MKNPQKDEKFGRKILVNFHDLVSFNVVSSLRHVQYTLSYIVEGGVGNEMDAHQGEELLGKQR